MGTRFPLFSEAIELHQLDCRSQRFTPKTVDTYKQRLTIFMRFAGDLPLNKVTPAILRAYLIDMQDRGLSSMYQVSMFRTLRAFLNYCVRDELIEKSPMKSVKMPRLEKKILPALTDDELHRIKKVCNLRDKAIIQVFVSSGVRNSELCNLNVEDVDLNTGVVMVRQGKGQKDRLTYIDSEARKLLLRYLKTRKRLKPSMPLFGSERLRNGRLKVHAIVHMLWRLQKETDVHVTAHGLRRTFATRAMRQNMNIHVLARIMGHANIDILKQYLDINDEDAQEAYSRIFL